MKQTKNKLVKLLSLTLIVGILMVPLTTMAAGFYSYNYTYEFKYRIPMSKLYLLNPDVYVRIKNNSSSATTGSFYVTLYQADGWGSKYMDEKSFPRDGSSERLFTTNGAFDDYWFEMRKADDGIYVEGYGTIKDY
jgi:hypothetical protein